MRNAASNRFLETLMANEALPTDLGSWLFDELADLNKPKRLLLAASLEGLCGIPDDHRESIADPLTAARKLCDDALKDLAPWWTSGKITLLRRKVAECVDLPGLLRTWCSWESTERHKRRQAARAKVRYADGRDFSLGDLQQLQHAH